MFEETVSENTVDADTLATIIAKLAELKHRIYSDTTIVGF